MTVQGQRAAIRGPRSSSKKSPRGPRDAYEELKILVHAEQGLCPTESPCTLNKPSGEHVGGKDTPHGRGSAVRGIPYPGPDHHNCCKSYCRRRAGHGQDSYPLRPELAVTIPSVEFPAMHQANLGRPSPRTA